MTIKKTLGVAAAAVGAVAVVAPLTSVVAAPASAAASLSWLEDGNSKFERRISDTTPAVGATVTVSTSFQRKISFEDIYNYKDITNACLKYVPGSATWEGSAISDVDTSVPGEVRVKSPNLTAWRVPGLGGGFGAKRTISMSYTVSAACATGDAMWTTMHYGGSLGSGIYNNPAAWQGDRSEITVAKLVKSASSTSVAVNPSPRATVASTIRATVNAGGKTATGTVDFFNNGTKIGSGTVANGSASMSWTPAAAGAYSIRAVYSGDDFINGSTSETVTGNVAAAPAPADPAGIADLTLSPTGAVTAGGKVSVTGKAGDRTTRVIVRVGGQDTSCSPVAVTAGNTFTCEITTTVAMNDKSVTVTPYNGTSAGATQTAGKLNVKAADGGDPGDGGDGGTDGGGDNGGGDNGGGDNGGGSLGSLGGGSLSGLFG